MVYSSNWITEMKKNYRHTQQHHWISHIIQKKPDTQKVNSTRLPLHEVQKSGKQSVVREVKIVVIFFFGGRGGQREHSGILHMFYILTWMMAKIHWAVHFWLVHKFLVKIVKKQTKTILISFSPLLLAKT